MRHRLFYRGWRRQRGIKGSFHEALNLASVWNLPVIFVCENNLTVGTVVGLVASGKTVGEVLADYPYLEQEDILEALAWRAGEREVPMSGAKK